MPNDTCISMICSDSLTASSSREEKREEPLNTLSSREDKLGYVIDSSLEVEHQAIHLQ